MAITGRWPRAIFYDSKTTLFNWAGSWRGAASQLLKKHGAQVDEQAFVETWVRGFEGLHRRAAFFRYTQVTNLAREALNNAYRMHGKTFKADFVGSTEQAGVAKPNPRTYQWVLRKTGMEPRDVLYCAAPPRRPVIEGDAHRRRSRGRLRGREPARRHAPRGTHPRLSYSSEPSLRQT
jgi:hypothetical protein